MATIHGAKLNGTVIANGLDTTVDFVFGTDPLLETGTIATAPLVPAGYDVVPVSADITDLLGNTIYYFKLEATNDLGLVSGEILSFTTPVDTDLPVAVTLPATDIV